MDEWVFYLFGMLLSPTTSVVPI